MARTTLLPVALLGVGIAVGGYFVDHASGQSRLPPPSTWPPRPDHIVNLRGRKDGMEDGDIAKIIEVPADRWLVLTDVRFDAFLDQGGIFGWASFGDCQFGENFNGAFVTKIYQDTNPTGTGGNAVDYSYYATAVPYSSPVGLVFRPGSRVEIRYSNASDAKGDAYFAHVTWNATGYFADF